MTAAEFVPHLRTKIDVPLPTDYRSGQLMHIEFIEIPDWSFIYRISIWMYAASLALICVECVVNNKW